MPPREAKSRRVEREYMADREFMTGFTAEEREAYILLSLFADDAGWLEWDEADLAASLYRWEPLEDRERKLAAFREHFEQSGRLRVFRCGHAFMPKVAKRPRAGGHEFGVQREHGVHSRSTRSQPKTTEVDSSQVRYPDLTEPKPHLTTTSPLSSSNEEPSAERQRAGSREGNGVESLASALERHGYKPGKKP